jgi:outer membrane protein assembly factor BamA
LTSKFKLLLIIFTAVTALLSVYGENPADSVEYSRIDYVRINKINIEINGFTRPGAVLRNIKIYEGEVFSDKKTLVQAVDKDVQELKNLRVFSAVQYNIEYSGTAEETEAAVNIKLKDSWSIFPFIIPSSSRNGSRISLEIVDKNFLGTLTELKLSGSLRVGENLSTGELGIQDWNVYLLWAGITFNQWSFSGIISQSHSSSGKTSGGNVLEHYTHDESSISAEIRYEIPALRNLYLYLNPYVSWRYNYKIHTDDSKIYKDSFVAGSGLGIDFNRINWIDFYRQGWSAGLMNIVSGGFGDSTDVVNLSTGRLSVFIITGPVNLNGRLSLLYCHGEDITSLGHY